LRGVQPDYSLRFTQSVASSSAGMASKNDWPGDRETFVRFSRESTIAMRILLSAFESYGEWRDNSSWNALVYWLSVVGGHPQVMTRKYPVDLVQLQARLERDLAQGVDAVLHLGQAPGISRIHLESIAINVAGITQEPGGDYGPILENAPVAYRTSFPLGEWVKQLRLEGIPAAISYHAGTYLCNAAMYLSHHWFARRHEVPRVGFIHLPLTPEQVLQSGQPLASMPLEQSAKAIGLLVERTLELGTPHLDPSLVGQQAMRGKPFHRPIS
jgi:pyroglutamyl-peptidase